MLHFARTDFVAKLVVVLLIGVFLSGCGAGGGSSSGGSGTGVRPPGTASGGEGSWPSTPRAARTLGQSRFMTDPNAMRAAAGRFDMHAQTVESLARRMWTASNLTEQQGSLQVLHQEILRDVLVAGDVWGGADSAACQEFVTELGRNFQIIYEQVSAKYEGAAQAQQSSNTPSQLSYDNTDRAFLNIENMLRGVRDDLTRDANNYEQQEQQSPPATSPPSLR